MNTTINLLSLINKSKLLSKVGEGRQNLISFIDSDSSKEFILSLPFSYKYDGTSFKVQFDTNKLKLLKNITTIDIIEKFTKSEAPSTLYNEYLEFTKVNWQDREKILWLLKLYKRKLLESNLLDEVLSYNNSSSLFNLDTNSSLDTLSSNNDFDEFDEKEDIKETSTLRKTQITKMKKEDVLSLREELWVETLHNTNSEILQEVIEKKYWKIEWVQKLDSFIWRSYYIRLLMDLSIKEKTLWKLSNKDKEEIIKNHNLTFNKILSNTIKKDSFTSITN